jgi:hypothetical protein
MGAHFAGGATTPASTARLPLLQHDPHHWMADVMASMPCVTVDTIARTEAMLQDVLIHHPALLGKVRPTTACLACTG